MITLSTIAQSRLSNQRIANPAPDTPHNVVRRMGMIQAQGYYGALWAVGLRTPHTTQDDIERALQDRQIVRSWPARGTLHFTAAEDIRWLLDLLAPRTIQHTAGRYRQLGLDEATFARSREWVRQALQGGNRLTRDEIYRGWEAAGVSPEGQRGIHMLGRLAMEGLICFGPRHGKQHTFVLLEEWTPAAQSLPHEQALAELTRRYFTSHGPATVKDFAWWSGLPLAEVRAGLEMAQTELEQVEVDGKAHWLRRSQPVPREALSTCYLLPGFDEYLVGYTDRSAVLDLGEVLRVNAGGGMLNPTIVIDGRVLGAWKRTLKKGSVVVTPGWFTSPTEAQQQAIAEAAGSYAAFIGVEKVIIG